MLVLQWGRNQWQGSLATQTLARVNAGERVSPIHQLVLPQQDFCVACNEKFGPG